MRQNNTGIWYRWTSTSLVLRIACGLAAGVILALTVPSLQWIGLFGSVFVNALKAVAPVLVFVLVMSSLASAESGLGKKMGRVIFLYILGTLLASFTAVLACFIFRPSMGTKADLTAQLPGEASGEVGNSVMHLSTVFENLLHSIVANPVDSLCNANYLGVLFWAVIIGIALRSLASPNTICAVSDFAESLSKVVWWVIQFAPIGVMGLVFKSVSTIGPGVFVTYGKLMAVLVGSILVMAFIVNPIVVAINIKGNPYPLVWRCISGSGINAFFTCSSAANIPVNMQLCKELGLDRNLYSVSIPLGATINMEGAAITITTLALALCCSLGIEVTLSSALVLCVIAAFGACGSSGVGGGSMLLVPMACSLFGLGGPMADLALGVGFTILFIQDPFETALNSSTDALFTAVADKVSRRKS